MPITNWTFIYPEDRKQNALAIWTEMRVVSTGLGLLMTEPRRMVVADLRTSTLVKSANDALDAKPNMVRGDSYNLTLLYCRLLSLICIVCMYNQICEIDDLL